MSGPREESLRRESGHGLLKQFEIAPIHLDDLIFRAGQKLPEVDSNGSVLFWRTHPVRVFGGCDEQVLQLFR